MRRVTVAAVLGTLAGTGLGLGAGLSFGSEPTKSVQTAADSKLPSASANRHPGEDRGEHEKCGDDKGKKGKKKKGKTPAPTTSPTTKPTTAPTTAPTTPPAGGLKNGTYAGAAQTNPYGTVQVTITVAGGKITAVTATYPTSPSTSASINGNAIPKLKSETLAAQSANIAAVSGASYTSAGFKASLASAIAKA